jgi:hypothetical protein
VTEDIPAAAHGVWTSRPSRRKENLMTETTTDSGKIANDVIGAWRLVCYVIEDADGGNRATCVPRRATITEHRLTLDLVERLVINGTPRGGRLTWEKVEVFEARTKAL